MPIDLHGLHPRPAGFNACGVCAYRRTATPAVCFACVDDGGAGTWTGPRCGVCAQSLDDGGPCPNAVCTLADRAFSRIHTVSDPPEAMWDALMSYKYGEQDRSWAEVLGRILVGYLEDHRDEMGRYDLITTGAIHIGPQAPRLWDYLRLIAEAAERAGPQWPFAPGLIEKSRPTARFLGTGVEHRRQVAEGELRDALSVPDPDRVAGRRILVFDDVYSEGYSLREMARVLLGAGAVEVAGLVLARRKGG